MAYVNGKRTVYCRHCYQTGHNRRSCPKLSPEMKARYATGDRARKCSWCSAAGHNRASCEKLKNDKLEYIKENAQYRQSVIADLAARGLGIGSLVYRGDPVEDISAVSPDCVYMVSNFDWSGIQSKNRYGYTVIVNPLHERAYATAFRLPSDKDAYYSSRCNLLTKRPAEEILASPPVDWLKGESGIDQYFNR